MKRFLTTLVLFAFLVYLLLFPKPAAEAARSGLTLWYQRLVPVLFPFMVLSGLMIQLDLISVPLSWVHPLFHLIWGTSAYGSYAIITGFFFGFPMGAKTIRDLLQKNLISDAEAEYLIGFVNNLSPAFVISYLVGECLQKPDLLSPALCILYGAPLLTGMIYMPKYRSQLPSGGMSETIVSGGQSGEISCPTRKASKVPLKSELVDACIFDGINSITRLGVYMIFFSILGSAVRQLPHLSLMARCILLGSIEITSGISFICSSGLSAPVTHLLVMILSSFGGICALAQTLSACPMSQSMFRHFLKARILSVALSTLMSLYLFL